MAAKKKSQTRKTKAKPKARPAQRASKPKAASDVVGSLAMVTLHVTDYDRTLAFYRDTLGFAEGEHVPQAGWLEFHIGPVVLGLHADPDRVEEGSRPPGGTTGFFFVVPDVDRAVRTLRERGVKISDEPEDKPYGRDATFLDPDGNLIGILTPA